jgi:hypothetical protein
MEAEANLVEVMEQGKVAPVDQEAWLDLSQQLQTAVVLVKIKINMLLMLDT